jgi:hypothetical protein
MFNIGSRADVAVARSAEIDGQGVSYAMTSLVHSVLVLGTTLLSLSILFFNGYVINLLSTVSREIVLG